jgi:hypothetical protein
VRNLAEAVAQRKMTFTTAIVVTSLMPHRQVAGATERVGVGSLRAADEPGAGTSASQGPRVLSVPVPRDPACV